MPLARSKQFEPGDDACALVTSRCHNAEKRLAVEGRRDAFLAHLDFLLSVFAIDLLAWAMPDNHWHGLPRALPEDARLWSREEVARRSLTLHPMRDWRLQFGKPLDGPPCNEEIAAWLADRDRDELHRSDGARGCGLARAPSGRSSETGLTLEQARLRLCSISAFMKEANEWIARTSNRIDDRTGAFFGGRFHSREVLDEGGELAAAIYVDLNEFRAFMVDLPEQSKYSSITRRVEALRRGIDSGLPLIAGLTDAQYLAVLDAVSRVPHFGRSIGASRFRRGLRPAKRTLPVDAPDIFARLDLPRLDSEDARVQELALRFAREEIEERALLAELAAYEARPEEVDQGGGVARDANDAAAVTSHDSLATNDASSEAQADDLEVVARARRALHADWRRACERERAHAPIGTPAYRDVRALRDLFRAGLAGSDGIHARSSSIGGIGGLELTSGTSWIEALERAARRRAQSWVVDALHRGRRATQRRLAAFMHRRGMRARNRLRGAPAARVDAVPSSRE